ncbi:chemotaxis protein CheB [uncultured Chitinophaga sp.]|uniref:chemotaxis protein CheB n=1 Tax=uncultured Chitinophaga sp. TaxID=339340 RepID=UPI0025D98144|nr:chemotaxis protein CheB [uncultured Chitinophaga sp.]
MQDDFFVVGLAASGLGISAMTSFFTHLSDAPNAAFIIATHQRRDRESLLRKIVLRFTAMPVHQVEGPTEIQPGHVYIITENTYIVIRDKLVTVEKRPHTAENNAIDILFKSIADQYRERAIGIVFWGMGNDAVNGSKEIEASGGFVIVQRPDRTIQSQMARSTVEHDDPDFIVDTEDIAAVLENYMGTYSQK